MKQFQLSVFPFNQFPAGVQQKVDDRKGKGSDKVQQLRKREKSFPEGREWKRRKGSEISWGGDTTAKPLVVLNISLGN